MDFFDFQNWQNIWGATIFFALPALFLFATMVYRKRKATGKGLIPPQIVRFLLVPFLLIHLVLTKIVSVPEEAFLIKVSKTFIIIILISFFFNAINYLLFSKNNILTKKEIIPKLGRDIMHIFFITIISACVLSNVWGLDLGNLLAALGVSSLVVGLALQEPLGNLFNGVFLLMASPFKKGDWIKVRGDIGKVAEINWRSVKIHTHFNEQIILPNNLLGKEKIKNLSRPNKIHAELLKFGFSYNDNPEKVKKVLLQIVQQNEKVLKNPAPSAITISYDDFAITYGLKFYLKDYEDIIILNDEINSAVYGAAKEHKLSIPFPRYDVEIQNQQNTSLRGKDLKKT